MPWKDEGFLLRISSMKLSVMSAIPEAWYKQKGDRDQKQNDDNDTDGPDPPRYRTKEGYKTGEHENTVVYMA